MIHYLRNLGDDKTACGKDTLLIMDSDDRITLFSGATCPKCIEKMRK